MNNGSAYLSCSGVKENLILTDHQLGVCRELPGLALSYDLIVQIDFVGQFLRGYNKMGLRLLLLQTNGDIELLLAAVVYEDISQVGLIADDEGILFRFKLLQGKGIPALPREDISEGNLKAVLQDHGVREVDKAELIDLLAVHLYRDPSFGILVQTENVLVHVEVQVGFGQLDSLHQLPVFVREIHVLAVSLVLEFEEEVQIRSQDFPLSD